MYAGIDVLLFPGVHMHHTKLAGQPVGPFSKPKPLNPEAVQRSGGGGTLTDLTLRLIFCPETLRS